MRLPLNQVGAVTKINRALNKFEQENERRPSVGEISEQTLIPEEKIDATLRSVGRHVSVDAPFSDSDEGSLLDVLVNEDAPTADGGLEKESLRSEIASALSMLSDRERKILTAFYGIDQPEKTYDEIARALNMLSDRERNILKAFYGIGQPEKTYDEIGSIYGLTRERVRQIKEKAIRRLRSSARNNTLKTYL